MCSQRRVTIHLCFRHIYEQILRSVAAAPRLLTPVVRDMQRLETARHPHEGAFTTQNRMTLPLLLVIYAANTRCLGCRSIF